MTIVAVESVTLDGVMQAPGRPDEDERGGFAHGGWAVPYNDPVMGRAMGERMARGGALLLGRRTYEDLYGYWPKQPPNPFTEKLTRTTKYVASTTLREPLPWETRSSSRATRSTRCGDMKGGAEDLGIIGSGALVRALARAGLVDEFLLLVHPLVLGCSTSSAPTGCSPVRSPARCCAVSWHAFRHSTVTTIYGGSSSTARHHRRARPRAAPQPLARGDLQVDELVGQVVPHAAADHDPEVVDREVGRDLRQHRAPGLCVVHEPARPPGRPGR